ncbi:hypothetical protein BSQ40_18150 [Serratia fonticola]|nr:hypothetical protein BSQ40_18150 [Serratia fonticola]
MRTCDATSTEKPEETACQGKICAAAARHLFDWPIPQPRVPLIPARLETLALLAPHPNPLPQGEGAGTVPCSGAEVICDRVDAEEGVP